MEGLGRFIIVCCLSCGDFELALLDGMANKITSRDHVYFIQTLREEPAWPGRVWVWIAVYSNLIQNAGHKFSFIIAFRSIIDAVKKKID